MNVLLIVLSIIISAILGAVISALTVGRRTRNEMAQNANRAAAAEARVEELRLANQEAARDFEKLRDQLQLAQNEKSAVIARSEEIEKKVKEYEELLNNVRDSMAATFKSLSSEALDASIQNLIRISEERFKSIGELSKSELDSRKLAVEELVRPLRELIATYKSEVLQVSDRAIKESATVGEQLRQLPVALTSLQTETSKLTRALRTPQIRGRWGEVALRRTVELAGMSSYCDFDEQSSVTTESGRLRPDMIVHLPAGREIVVDSKVPLMGFLESIEAVTEQEQKAALKRHADHVKSHISKLARKEYWDQFEKSPDFVVLFIPNDSFLAAAVETDSSIVETALNSRVMLATPTTLVALLRAIEYGWRQEAITKNAQAIAELGYKLAERLSTLSGYFASLGKSIGKSVEVYNTAIRSFESRVMVTAREFVALGGTNKEPAPELKQIQSRPELPMSSEISESVDAENEE